jgi:hypothetical protein
MARSTYMILDEYEMDIFTLKELKQTANEKNEKLRSSLLK